VITGPLLLVVFVIALGILLFSIIKLKANPFLALFGTAVITGFMVRMPIAKIGSTITAGFGGTLGGIGIIIGLGIILGRLLAEANATDQIAETMLSKVGEKRSPLALAMSGYLISIPVFQDAAFVILMPLARKLSKVTGISLLTMITALGVGTIVTHSLVIPTPGPVAVAGNMGVDFGIFLLYAAIVALPAVLVGGVLYANTLKNRPATINPDAEAAFEAAHAAASGTRPSPALSFGLLLFPILLILVGSIMSFILPKDSSAVGFFQFIGDKNVAVFLGVILAGYKLKPFIKAKFNDVVIEAAGSAGMIFLITGAGGGFGKVITESGIGKYMVDSMSVWSISPIILAFILSQILRTGQGSTTVALITTSAILGPLGAQLGASPVLVGLAACAGGIGLSMPNDSGFWVVSRFGGISVQDTLRTWTAGGTIAGLTALGAILILNMFSGILPGL